MSGMKDLVHTAYLKKLEDKRSLPELGWRERTVAIIGSDSSLNVGANVALQVAELGARVIEGDRHAPEWKWNKFQYTCDEATDLVICCSSIQMDWIENMQYSDMERVVHDTLVDPMHYTSVFAERKMNRDFRKHIVFIGSMAYRQVLNASSAYCAAKAGLAHYARCAAWELTPKGFTIGIVHPGNIENTPMTENTIDGIATYRNLTTEEARDYWASLKLTDKWLSAADVAKEVVYLLTSSPHHSGVQVELGGGLR